MNTVNLIGRLTRDPEVRTSSGEKQTTIATFTIAVDRIGSEEADFIRVIAFGRAAEFAEDYFTKGLRVGVTGRLQTGSYENKDGVTVYTCDVIAERLDFADGKRDDRRSADDRKDDRKDDGYYQSGKRSGRSEKRR